MAVVLISPPMTKASEPLLGIATLQAQLRTQGIRCHAIDANAEAQDWLLDRDRLDAAVDAVEGSRVDARRRRRLQAWRGLRVHLPSILQELRGPSGYRSLPRHRTLVTSLGHAFALAGALHQFEQGSPIRLSPADYGDRRYCDMDSASVAELAARPEDCVFHAYYLEHLIPRIRALRPRVLGLSLIFRSQLLPGIALAALLRRELPDVHLTLGGELISAWAEILASTALPELADSILCYEGERGLLELAREVDRGPEAALDRVSNLRWRDEAGRFHANPDRKLASLAEVATPDFDGMPWELYFAPGRTAPMVSARGCYWNRCTFCPEVINPQSELRLAGIERLVADMEAIHEAHGVESFHFIDSALPPKTLRGVARHVRDQRRPYRWYGFSRLEKSLLAPGFAEELARGGCRMLKLGLETASQRLLDGMDKKQELGTVSAILRCLRRAGVMVHAYLMFGTPREHREDAEATERFIARHADAIQFVNCSIMNLAHGSPMAEEPARHGIHEVRPFEIEGRHLDLALYSNFVGEGWGRLAARRFLHDRFLRQPSIRRLHRQTPAHFDANHSFFLHGALGMDRRAEAGPDAAEGQFSPDAASTGPEAGARALRSGRT